MRNDPAGIHRTFLAGGGPGGCAGSSVVVVMAASLSPAGERSASGRACPRRAADGWRRRPTGPPACRRPAEPDEHETTPAHAQRPRTLPAMRRRGERSMSVLALLLA